MAMTQQQKKIVHRIRTLHAVDKQPLNLTHVRVHHPKLLKQVMSLKHFRGWRNALEAAGLSYKSIRTEIHDYCHCAICGKKLKSLHGHLRAIHKISKKQYVKRFPHEPTTSDAMRLKATFSLRYRPHWEKVWSPEYVVDYLIYKYDRGEDLSPWTIYQKEPCVHANMKGYFGTYRAAIEAAGIDYGEVRVIEITEQWNEKKVLERIRKLHRKKPLNSTSDIRQRDSRLYDSCHRYFGGPVPAIEAAGIPYTRLKARRDRRWNKRAVTRTIRVLATNGLSLRPSALPSHMAEQSDKLLDAATRCFGSWENAVQCAGIDYENHRGRRTL
jgi:hypothetical protein